MKEYYIEHEKKFTNIKCYVLGERFKICVRIWNIDTIIWVELCVHML